MCKNKKLKEMTNRLCNITDGYGPVQAVIIIINIIITIIIIIIIIIIIKIRR